jgi:hypothetical protein
MYTRYKSILYNKLSMLRTYFGRLFAILRDVDYKVCITEVLESMHIY